MTTHGPASVGHSGVGTKRPGLSGRGASPWSSLMRTARTARQRVIALTKWKPAGSLTFAACYPSSWKPAPNRLTPRQWREQMDADYAAKRRQVEREQLMHTVLIAILALFVGGALGYLFGARVKNAALNEIRSLSAALRADVARVEGRLVNSLTGNYSQAVAKTPSQTSNQSRAPAPSPRK